MDNIHTIVRSSLDIASSKALELKHTQITPLHLFFGLLKNKMTYTHQHFGEHIDDVQTRLKEFPQAKQAVDVSEIRPAPALVNWLTQANGSAAEQGRTEVMEKDFLRHISSALPNLDLDLTKLKVNEDEDYEIPKFLINLNERAKEGKLDPVIGRTKEIRAMMEILGRRNKNNPVLVGPAGVGKTAIVEGLAEAIVSDQVPDLLKGKTIYSMELGSLVAGTKYRGDFEERIQALLKFTKESAGSAIVFIDEIHQIIGAGKTDGAMDAANLLKPALSRGEIHCIGATTEDEYQKYILNDSALDRRFRSIPVLEPSKEDSIEILMGLKDKYEAHHGIRISDEAIYSSVMLSDQYITNKNLPDKAIDLIDEATSSLKLSAEAMPSDLEILKSEIRNKKILAKVHPSDELEQELSNLQKDFDKKLDSWNEQVLELKQVAELKNQLDRYKFDLEKAQREQNYEEASRIRFSLIPEIETKLESSDSDWVLTEKDVAKIISRQTAIPVEKILKTKQDNLLKLEGVLNKRVFGQQDSLKEISETLLTSYAGLTHPNRPLGTFLLLGPTGVGKTETAKAIAQELFDDESKIVRLDLSEYSEKHSVAKLIGAPAGYVGYDDGGILTEAIRRHPYSVVLFDEVEKAHPDFSDILLQILDEGRLTDNKGRTISFRNTIIFLTSNSKNLELDFKPEVIGRLDSVLTYHAISDSVMSQLVEKEIERLRERVKDKKITLTFSEDAIEHIAKLGYDSTYGARPLTATFNRLVSRPLSKIIIGGDKLDHIDVKLKDGSISLDVGA